MKTYTFSIPFLYKFSLKIDLLNMSQQSAVDMQTVRQMQEEFKKTYDEKAQQLQSTY